MALTHGIVLTASGDVIGYTNDPTTAVQAGVTTSIALPGDFETEDYRWDIATQSFIKDYSNVNNVLKTRVDFLREEWQQKTITLGYGKSQEYSYKASEILLYDIMDPDQFAALTEEEQKEKFTFAYQDMLELGGTLTDAIERFREGSRASKYNLAVQAAKSQRAKTLVRVEATKAAKEAAVEEYANALGTDTAGDTTTTPDIYWTDDLGNIITTELDIPILV